MRFKTDILEPVGLPEFLLVNVESEELNSPESTEHGLPGEFLFLHCVNLLSVLIVFSLLCVLLILEGIKDSDTLLLGSILL